MRSPRKRTLLESTIYGLFLLAVAVSAFVMIGYLADFAIRVFAGDCPGVCETQIEE